MFACVFSVWLYKNVIGEFEVKCLLWPGLGGLGEGMFSVSHLLKIIEGFPLLFSSPPPFHFFSFGILIWLSSKITLPAGGLGLSVWSFGRFIYYTFIIIDGSLVVWYSQNILEIISWSNKQEHTKYISLCLFFNEKTLLIVLYNQQLQEIHFMSPNYMVLCCLFKHPLLCLNISMCVHTHEPQTHIQLGIFAN